MAPRGAAALQTQVPRWSKGQVKMSHPFCFGKWEMKFDACHEGGYSELPYLQPACPVNDLDLASIHIGGLRHKLKMKLSQREAEIPVRS